MASKFKIWVDQDNVNNVEDATTFASDTQRIAGFTPGTPASSVRVNTALRQANLIACALMNIVQPDGDQDVNGATVKSSVSDIQTLLNTYLTQTLVAKNSTYATKIGTSSTHPAIGSADRNVYVNNDGVLTAGSYIPKLNNASQSSSATSFYAPTGAGTNGQVLKSSGSGAPSWADQSSLSVGSATNVTTNINSHAITSIFENDGITAKSATNATNDGNGLNINENYLLKIDGIKLLKNAYGGTAKIGPNYKVLIGRMPEGKDISDVLAVTFAINSSHFQGIQGGYQNSESEFDCLMARSLDQIGLFLGCVRIDLWKDYNNNDLYIYFDSINTISINATGQISVTKATDTYGDEIGSLKQIYVYFK